MRWGLCIIAIGLLGGGCVTRQPAADGPATLSAVRRPVSAGALVFDPPVAANQPPLALGRDGRTPGAFWGYPSVTTTYFYLRIDDRQISDGSYRSDRYERRAISHTIGVSYR